ACAAPLLPEARDGAREADGDRAVQQSDVDAELERVRRGDPEELSLDEAALDVSTLRRRVPGAVRREPLRGRRVDAVGRQAVDQLGLLAALRETDRPQIALHELRHQPGGVAERARAQSELGVEQLRVPESDGALGAWRS